MEQITVPQFLDVEDKIIGPITVRQFIEILVGAMVGFIFYKIFDFSLFIITGLLVLAITVLFAFAKVGGQPFHNFLLNFIATLKSPKLKIWKKIVSKDEIRESMKKPKEVEVAIPVVRKRAIAPSSLSELSLIVDTGGVYRGEGIVNSENKINKPKK